MHICNICKNKFKGRNGRANKYCGPECYNAAQRNGDYKTGRKSIPCKACSKPVFDIYEKDKDGNVRTEYFCRDCHLEHLARQRGNCAHCKNPIPAGKSGNKYCSDNCHDEAKRTPPRHCTECNAWFTPIKLVTTTSGKTMYVGCGRQMQCSSECGNKAQFNEERNKKISVAHQGEKHWNYKGGTSEYRGPNWEEQRWLTLLRDNFSCVQCGIEDSKSNPVVVHHRWPYHCFYDYKEANELDNLETLCKKDHMILHNILNQFDLPYVKGEERPGSPKGERIGTSKFSDAHIEDIVELIARGVPLSEIEKSHNISKSHLNSIANGKSRRHATGGKIKGYKKAPAKGAKIAKTKLDEIKVPQIRIDLANGMSFKDVATKNGVAKTTIQAVHYGKTWKHVK